MSKCENCEQENNGEYGSGRFCSSKCARGFSTKNKRQEINEKVSKTLTKELYDYKCEKCNIEFKRKRKFLKYRKIHCDKCKNYRAHSLDNPMSLYDLSLRTICKVIKRAKIKCMMCNWDKTSLDVHHIIQRKDGGSNNDDNLICVCPNCHRLAHENKYNKKELQLNSIKYLFSNWKDYYHPSN